MTLRRLWVSSLAVASLVLAQFPPTPEGVTRKQVTGLPGVSISYKETTICETKAKAWSGFVNMPISYLSDIETAHPYNISMFFWYFQAREDPENAPTGIYLAGGPGESSLYGATLDGGPCYINSDSNSTTDNPWSMNNKVNMLYVDQPVGTGYSYDMLVKSTLDLTFHGEVTDGTGIVPFQLYGDKVPEQNTTFLYGTLPSQNPEHTSNTTAVAAVTFWHFAQVWFSEFPEYTTTNRRVSIWGNSYGGYWVTGSGAYIMKQNAKIQSGNLTGTAIDLDTIGFTNGCVDQLYQAESYIHLAYDNVYDFPLIDKATYEEALHSFKKPQGCLDLLTECRKLGDLYDPNEFAINKKVNDVCLAATKKCSALASLNQPPFSKPEVGSRSAFDIAHFEPDPFPRSYPAGFFNQEWVQKELGSPVNFTANSNLLANYALIITGDPYRRAGMKDVEYLLNNGVQVTFIYGDRDYRCPWLGMEKLSLAANWTGANAFRDAGYADIHTNGSYKGGVVRQHGSLSFSRVFQAGHDAYPYQPETIYKIFDRAIFNKDIATGSVSTSGTSNNDSTSGPSSSESIKLKLPPPPPPSCYLWAMKTTCTTDQLVALEEGTAEVEDFTVKKPAGGGGAIPAVPEGKYSTPSSSDASSKSSSQKSAALGTRDLLLGKEYVLPCIIGVVLVLVS